MRNTKTIVAAAFTLLAFFGVGCGAEGKKSAASKATGSEQKPTDQINIQAPKDKVKYEMVDSYLHYLDFLEKSDGFEPLVKAMDMSGVKSAIILGSVHRKASRPHFDWNGQGWPLGNISRRGSQVLHAFGQAQA